MPRMKLYICYPPDKSPYSPPCKVFGMRKGEKPTEGWETFATVDFEMPPKFMPALIKRLNDSGDPYTDETLAETISEDSAQVLFTFIRYLLDSPEFIRVSYTARERILKYMKQGDDISTPGEFAEWRRRVALVKSP